MTAVVRPTVTAAAMATARMAPYGPAQQQAAYVYDDFDAPDGPLNGRVCPTGQTWALTGASYLTTAIASRKVVIPVNAYCYLPYGSAIPRISMTFSFSHGTGTDDRSSQNACLIVSKASLGLDDMLHLNLGPRTWDLTKRLGGGAFTSILNGSYDLIDDVPYEVPMEIDGDTVTAYPPQSAPVSATDSDIGTLSPLAFGCWQTYTSTNALVAKIWRVSMGPDQQGRAAAAIGAAPSAEIGWLKGAGLTQRQRVTATLTGGAGWYRVATQTSQFMMGAIAGCLSFTARDLYLETTARVTAEGDYSYIGTPVLQFVHNSGGGSACIDQVRLSRDSSTYQTALDVHVSNAYGGTVSVIFEFEGYFTVVSTPVVGATALPTESLVLSL